MSIVILWYKNLRVESREEGVGGPAALWQRMLVEL